MKKVVAAASVLVVLVLAWMLFPSSRDDPPEDSRSPRDAAAAKAPPQRLPDRAADAPRREVPQADAQAADEFDLGEAAGLSWANVDLDAVRAAMPDNLFWKMSSPTQDEAVQEARAAERERWNVEYGKVLSGTGSEAEVRAYYDQRARLFGDYVEFTSYLLDHYKSDLPERDVGMLELARKLSLARLEEIPRKVEEALQRKQKQDEARAAWLADEKAFADSPAQGGAVPEAATDAEP